MPQYTYARRRSRPSEAYSRLLLASTKRRKRLRLVSSSSDSASHLRRYMIGSHVLLRERREDHVGRRCARHART